MAKKDLKQIMSNLGIVSNRSEELQSLVDDPVLGVSQYFDGAIKIAQAATGQEKAIHVEKLRTDLQVEFWADDLCILTDDDDDFIWVTYDLQPDKVVDPDWELGF